MSNYYIGLMSGTSFDGVDASLVKTDGVDNFTCIVNHYIPYSKELSSALNELSINIGPFLNIERRLTEVHIEAVNAIIKISRVKASDIKAIGFHGQTIKHDPQNQTIWQIGNPHLLASKTNINVIYDFRRRDMALGGQGAPLVPIFHQMIAKDFTVPVGIINIGGVSNITYIDKKLGQLIAFDTGPGNGLIDDACRMHFNLDYDDEGRIAESGKVDFKIINEFLDYQYFKLPYPKSLDRNIFKPFIKTLQDHTPEDMVASLTYFTVLSIIRAVKLLPNYPEKIFLCGGGSKNSYLVKCLNAELKNNNINCEVEDISIINGFDANYVESQAFAYLAARFCSNLPSAFPSTTGTIKENICGVYVKKY